MRETDIVCVEGTVHPRDSYQCLLTGRPCGVFPVTLRRMFLVPPVWFGRKAVVALPFEKLPTLAPWQYLRMVRWIIVLLLGSTLAPFVYRLSATPTLPRLTLVALCAGIWYGLGRFLDSREVVRLLAFDRKHKTVTLRFNSMLTAQRAREALVEKSAST